MMLFRAQSSIVLNISTFSGGMVVAAIAMDNLEDLVIRGREKEDRFVKWEVKRLSWRAICFRSLALSFPFELSI